MKSNIPKKYWSGKGRKIIAIPHQVLKKQKLNNTFLNSLYITELGYYPHASKHHTHRKNGSPENILIYCTDGTGWVQNPRGRHDVSSNNFFILPCNTEHEYGASDEDPWSIYWIKYGGQGLNSLNDLAFAKYYFGPKHFPCKTDAIHLFNEMFSVLEQGYSRQYLVYVNMMLVNFLTLFFFQHGSVIKKETTNPHDIIIQKAIGHMQANLDIPVTNSELSIAAGCSCSQLSALFKNNTGYSPINYFNHLKIQKACQYFYATNALVKEVAAKLGYDDPYYFSRLFTKLMGVSPNKYRNRNVQK